MKKPKLDESKLTAAGKRQVQHITEYYQDEPWHKIRNKGWSREDVARAVILEEKKDKHIWKKKS